MFSVIIPTFNRVTVLEKAILSVLRQSYQNFELIIVDNGSSDETASLVGAYKKKYKKEKIKYFYQSNTGSPAGSRNTGIKLSKYNWVCFLDSDDEWLPEKLEKVQNGIKNVFEDVVAIAHWEFLNKNGKASLSKLGQRKTLNQYDDLLLRGNKYSTSTMTVRKDALEKCHGFDERERYFGVEDYHLWMELSKIGKIKTIKSPLSVCNVDKDGFSANIADFHVNLKNLVKDHMLNNYKTDKHKIKKHLARIDYYEGRAFQKIGNPSSTYILWKSILVYPFSIKKIVSLLFSLLKIKL